MVEGPERRPLELVCRVGAAEQAWLAHWGWGHCGETGVWGLFRAKAVRASLWMLYFLSVKEEVPGLGLGELDARLSPPLLLCPAPRYLPR